MGTGLSKGEINDSYILLLNMRYQAATFPPPHSKKNTKQYPICNSCEASRYGWSQVLMHCGSTSVMYNIEFVRLLNPNSYKKNLTHINSFSLIWGLKTGEHPYCPFHSVPWQRSQSTDRWWSRPIGFQFRILWLQGSRPWRRGLLYKDLQRQLLLGCT